MAGIFLSYSRADSESAFRIVQGLRALGIDVWWDQDMPGVDWQYELSARIDDMAAVLVLWSVHSAGSKSVRDEARLGDKREKLINALIGLREPPEPFDRINGLPIDGWNGHDPHSGWRRLIQTVEMLLVRIGDAEPGSVIAALDRLDDQRRKLVEDHTQAQDFFAECQQALADAQDNHLEAQAALNEAREELARAGELRFSAEIVRAAQRQCDDKAASLAQAETNLRSARGKLSHASRSLKNLSDQLMVQAPAEAPSPSGEERLNEETRKDEASQAKIAAALAIERAAAAERIEREVAQERQTAVEAAPQAEEQPKQQEQLETEGSTQEHRDDEDTIEVPDTPPHEESGPPDETIPAAPITSLAEPPQRSGGAAAAFAAHRNKVIAALAVAVALAFVISQAGNNDAAKETPVQDLSSTDPVIPSASPSDTPAGVPAAAPPVTQDKASETAPRNLPEVTYRPPSPSPEPEPQEGLMTPCEAGAAINCD